MLFMAFPGNGSIQIMVFYFYNLPTEMCIIIYVYYNPILQIKMKVRFKERLSNLLNVEHLLGRRAGIKRIVLTSKELLGLLSHV